VPVEADAAVPSGPEHYAASVASLFNMRRPGAAVAHSPIGLAAASAAAASVEGAAADAAADAATVTLTPQYWVRVVYNGQALVLPGQTSEYTDLEAFRALLSGLVPADYASECGVPELAPEIPRLRVPVRAEDATRALQRASKRAVPAAAAPAEQREAALAARDSGAPVPTETAVAVGFETLMSDAEDREGSTEVPRSLTAQRQ